MAGLVLAAVFVLASMLSLRSTWDRVDEMFHGDRYVSSPFGVDSQTLKVNGLEPEAERAGLRKGDLLLRVNGQPVRGRADVEVPVRRARSGDSLLLHVRRTGTAVASEQDIPVPLRRFTYVGYAPGSAAYVLTILFRNLTPLFCLVLGFWVAAVRLGDRAAWTLLLLMLSVANLIMDSRTSYGHEGVLQPILAALNVVLIRLGPLALLYFAIIFPERLGLDRRFPWIKWIVLFPMIVRAGMAGIASGFVAHHYDLAAPLMRF